MFSRLANALCDTNRKQKSTYLIQNTQPPEKAISNRLDQLYFRLENTVDESEQYDLESEIFNEKIKFSRITGRVWRRKITT